MGHSFSGPMFSCQFFWLLEFKEGIAAPDLRISAALVASVVIKAARGCHMELVPTVLEVVS